MNNESTLSDFRQYLSTSLNYCTREFFTCWEQLACDLMPDKAMLSKFL